MDPKRWRPIRGVPAVGLEVWWYPPPNTTKSAGRYRVVAADTFSGPVVIEPISGGGQRLAYCDELFVERMVSE